MTAVNLALALAEIDHTVVVVDGDLRRPRVASCLDLVGQAGLSTVLTGEASLREALQETRFPRLAALTSGAIPPNPTELLESQAAKNVLSELSRQYDYVIVDSPSLVVTDAALLAASSQGVLMVARFGKTRRKQLADAIHSLRLAGAPVLGAVLTMTPHKKQSKGGAYYDSASASASAVHRDSRGRAGRWRLGRARSG